MKQLYDVDGDNCAEQPRWACNFGGNRSYFEIHHVNLHAQVTSLTSISGHTRSGKSEVQSEFLRFLESVLRTIY